MRDGFGLTCRKCFVTLHEGVLSWRTAWGPVQPEEVEWTLLDCPVGGWALEVWGRGGEGGLRWAA